LFLLLVISELCSATIIDRDFYSDANIVEGDWYGLVRIYDTPPYHTTVNMTGGSLSIAKLYDSSTLNIFGGYLMEAESYNTSILNFFGGNISSGLGAWENSTMNIWGGIIGAIGTSNSSTVNLRGGQITNWVGGHIGTTINVFGKELSKINEGGLYGDGQVTGLWQDNTPFTINLIGTDTYSVVNLIPEPATIFLLSFGIFFTRKRK